MTLTLNTVSGVLHRSPRCAGRDERWHVELYEPQGEQTVAVQQHAFAPLYRVDHRCRKCLR